MLLRIVFIIGHAKWNIKSIFPKSMYVNEDAVFDVQMEAMEKVTKAQMDEITGGAQAITVDMGRSIGYAVRLNSDGTIKILSDVTKMTIKIGKSKLEDGKYLIHAYPLE